MKKISLIWASLLFLPSIVISATDIDAAVQDVCDCGFPPSTSCMDKLAKKYPEIDKSTELQDRVMSKVQNECGPGAKSSSTEDSIQNLVGNQNLDLTALLGGSAEALDGINAVVSSTEDCSTESFKLAIPKNWQCRKQDQNAKDVTLYNNGNQLNVSVGRNQGKTSCTVIPICTSEDFELSEKFDTTLYKNPMVGTYEYAGLYKNDNVFKLTITSTKKPTKAELGAITEILDSFEKR